MRFYEPFCGSGSTIVVAETTGRVCLAMELDPCYVDVAVLRCTGRMAVLAGGDRVFDDIAARHAVPQRPDGQQRAKDSL